MSSLTGTTPSDANGRRIVLSLDAMGGDKGPAAVVAGLRRFLAETSDVDVILHGPEDVLAPLVKRRGETDSRIILRHAPDVVSMSDKPSQVMRSGKNTSMWSAVEAVAAREAAVCISCGNTGALMAVSMLRLRKVPGVNRPAIACLWPSRNPHGFNVMLDCGADIRADADDLLTYALMGTSYARNGMNLPRPRVGLLNVGTEEHKGHAEMKLAFEKIAAAAPLGDFEFVGFVEGGDLPSSRVDVIVTDGFTGNIALKTGEGTAKLISEFLREAFAKTLLSRFAALMALTSLRRLAHRMDPRRVNGGVFLGLNGTVVKSHGGADATGVAAALALAHRLAQSGFAERLAARVASAIAHAQDDAKSSAADEAAKQE